MKYKRYLALLCSLAGCTQTSSNDGPRVAWLENPNDPQVLVGSFSGKVAIRDGCVGVESVPGNFLQAVFRTRPMLEESERQFRSITYGKRFIVGEQITGEGEVYSASEGKRFLAASGASPCSDQLLIIKRVNAGDLK